MRHPYNLIKSLPSSEDGEMIILGDIVYFFTDELGNDYGVESLFVQWIGLSENDEYYLLSDGSFEIRNSFAYFSKEKAEEEYKKWKR